MLLEVASHSNERKTDRREGRRWAASSDDSSSSRASSSYIATCTSMRGSAENRSIDRILPCIEVETLPVSQYPILAIKKPLFCDTCEGVESSRPIERSVTSKRERERRERKERVCSMSKLSDYSKFDNLPDDSDEDSHASGSGVDSSVSVRDESAAVSSAAGSAAAAAATTARSTAPTSTGSASAAAPAAPAPAPIQTKMTKKNDDGRYVFECNGRKIYEWDQNLEGMWA